MSAADLYCTSIKFAVSCNRGRPYMSVLDILADSGGPEYILLNDFTCRKIRLHNADRFNRTIALGSIQRYAV